MNPVTTRLLILFSPPPSCRTRRLIQRWSFCRHGPATHCLKDFKHNMDAYIRGMFPESSQAFSRHQDRQQEFFGFTTADRKLIKQNHLHSLSKSSPNWHKISPSLRPMRKEPTLCLQRPSRRRLLEEVWPLTSRQILVSTHLFRRLLGRSLVCSKGVLKRVSNGDLHPWLGIRIPRVRALFDRLYRRALWPGREVRQIQDHLKAEEWAMGTSRCFQDTTTVTLRMPTPDASSCFESQPWSKNRSWAHLSKRTISIKSRGSGRWRGLFRHTRKSEGRTKSGRKSHGIRYVTWALPWP